MHDESDNLKSLTYFHPRYMSLTEPHPLWTSAGSSPAKIAMATVQAQMLSGKYRTQQHCSHWSPDSDAKCLLSLNCTENEDIAHILTSCEALEETRAKLSKFTEQYTIHAPLVSSIVQSLCNPRSPDFVQFLLDCSVFPEVIRLVQQEGAVIHTYLFDISRTWVYSLHKQRLKLLGRWNYI